MRRRRASEEINEINKNGAKMLSVGCPAIKTFFPLRSFTFVVAALIFLCWVSSTSASAAAETRPRKYNSVLGHNDLLDQVADTNEVLKELGVDITSEDPDLLIDVDLKREEEEKNGRHYAVLLSRHGSLSASSEARSVATGRLYFRKKVLAYSFVTSPGFGTPQLLTFLDDQANIVEEFPLQQTHFQNETNKICGSWQLVPKRYRRQLRLDTMYAQLTSTTGEAIGGRVAKHYGLSSELFSALLLPEGPLNAQRGGLGAGTAIVSLQVATGSAHVNLLISGMFEVNGDKNKPVEVEFETRGQVQEVRTIRETLLVQRTDNALTSVDFKTVLDGPELEALGRGHLKMTVRVKRGSVSSGTRGDDGEAPEAAVEAPAAPEAAVVVSGYLVTRFTCDMFDCIILPDPLGSSSSSGSGGADEEDEDQVLEGDQQQRQHQRQDQDQLQEHPDSSGRMEAGFVVGGVAWLTTHSSGRINYDVRILNAPAEPNLLLIDNGKRSQRLLRVVHRVDGPAFVRKPPSPGLRTSGFLSGLDAQDVEDLFKSNLHLKVGFVGQEGTGGHHHHQLTCRIVPHTPPSPAMEMADTPIVLLPTTTSSDGQFRTMRSAAPEAANASTSSSSAALSGGIAWANVDSTCRLNFDVRLNPGVVNLGVNPALQPEQQGQQQQQQQPDLQLVLKDFPIVKQNRRNAALVSLAPVRSTDLQAFRAGAVRAAGHQDNLHKLTMARMNAGDAAFMVVDRDQQENGGDDTSGKVLLEGHIFEVRAPDECLPRFSRNDLELMPGFLNDLSSDDGTGLSDASSSSSGGANFQNARCVYETAVYDDGDQWTATHEACKMCSCQRGKVVCDAVLCPATNCSNPIILENECCPTCSSRVASNPAEDDDPATRGCYFEGDKKFHPAGSKWHPYIPPWGFSRCALCTCKADTLTIECDRKRCPALHCSPELQVRPDSLACCKVCTAPPPTPAKPKALLDAEMGGRLGDMGRVRTDQDILAEGGCTWREEVRENGAIWHPSVLPYGEISCVTCKCKDGNADCRRKDCPTLSCQYKVQDQNACCPRCAVNRSETKKARKLKRLMKIQKIRRMRKLKEQKLRLKGEADGGDLLEEELDTIDQ